VHIGKGDKGGAGWRLQHCRGEYMNQHRCKAIVLAISIPGALLLFVLAGRSIHSTEGLSEGEVVPSAVLRSTDGTEINTRSWRGMPTVLVLFRSSCSACRKQIANLEAVAADCPELRIALLSLSSTAPAEKVSFTVYFDPEGDFVRQMRRLRVPTLYWIDADGRVKYVRTGCREAASDVSLFRSLLGNNPISNSSPLLHAPGRNQGQEIVSNDSHTENEHASFEAYLR